MRIINQHRRGLSGILLVLFLSVFFVKDLHSHKNVHTCAGECSNTSQEQPNSNEHNPADCFICKFLFSPFLAEADASNTFSQLTYTIIQTEIPETFTVSAHFSFNLRAPPSLFQWV